MRFSARRHPAPKFRLRFANRNLPEAEPLSQVTAYRFKIWPQTVPEPADWTWVQNQGLPDALRAGGVALVAHYADVSFGDLRVRRLE